MDEIEDPYTVSPREVIPKKLVRCSDRKVFFDYNTKDN